MTPTLNLSDCEFNKVQKSLSVSNTIVRSVYAGRGYPTQLMVRSEHTGRVIMFEQIREGHPMFDYDFWDGEMMVYEPVTDIQHNVRTLTIHNFY